jgi:hypothetical protein
MDMVEKMSGIPYLNILFNSEYMKFQIIFLIKKGIVIMETTKFPISELSKMPFTPRD